MITNRKELYFYIRADRMMNSGNFKVSLKERIKRLVRPNVISCFLESLRYYEYYINTKRCFFLGGVIHPKCLYHIKRYFRLGPKLGFTISPNTLGYGVAIPHYGTIVIGPSNRIGNFAVLNTSICIVDAGSQIGDAFYCSTGAKIISKVVLGNDVTLAANCVLKRVGETNSKIMMGGIPAMGIREDSTWYIRDGQEYTRRADAVLALKRELGL